MRIYSVINPWLRSIRSIWSFCYGEFGSSRLRNVIAATITWKGIWELKAEERKGIWNLEFGIVLR